MNIKILKDAKKLSREHNIFYTLPKKTLFSLELVLDAAKTNRSITWTGLVPFPDNCPWTIIYV
ncbi:hypothetical protein BpHYR1_054563 [Brachionus plicatilis]|uniref:Uncharacterized protein n=1 Tax=Brachionus plicatilis TaxID=10195 RepID=A0A3M7SFG3_BRAPC|nr:hypothetical protein BpHYR1_054563 [Brachionus plicatilis]